MFSTRLNPTKPPAAHRAILERVGAACRELRPIEEACCLEGRPNERTTPILAKHGALKVGIGVEFGGAGTDPLLVAMSAERIGREGSRLVELFASYIVAAAVVGRHGAAEQKARLLPALARGELSLERDSRACVELGAIDVEIRAMLAGLTQRRQLKFTADLTGRLAFGGGSIGILSDCLESSVELIVNQIDVASARALRLHIAQTASDLEATRALVYAATELKSEHDRRPDSGHLRLEAGTLVAEASFFAAGAVNRMFGRSARIDIDGKPLLSYLPPRHRRTDRDELIFDKDTRSLVRRIARYYLFQ
jgi:alkylation response protein AidB-like acyl-CoA dehydrogenase